MVEENGTPGGGTGADALSMSANTNPVSAQHVVAVTSMVQLTLPAQTPSAQVIISLVLNYIFHSIFPTIFSTSR